jgi:hypothetical protein
MFISANLADSNKDERKDVMSSESGLRQLANRKLRERSSSGRKNRDSINPVVFSIDLSLPKRSPS